MNDYTWVDYIIIGIFFGSMFTGLMRGFLKEALSLANWIVASFIASNFATTLAAYFSGTVQNVASSTIGSAASGLSTNAQQTISLVSVGASFFAIFVVSFMIGGIVSYFVTSVFTGVNLSISNRILGAGFGFVRGFIVVVVVLFLAELSPVVNQPAWTNSQLESNFESSVGWLSNIVSPSLQAVKTKAEQAFQGIGSQMQNVGNTLGGLGK